MNQEQILDNQIPSGKIYKDKAIYVGTFLGGPIVAGYFMAENFKVFGERDKVNQTWIFTIIATIVIFGTAFLIPDTIKIPGQIIPVISIVAVSYLVKHFQAKNIESHKNSGGEFFGWGRVIAVGLIGLALIIVTVIAVFIVVDLTTSHATT